MSKREQLATATNDELVPVTKRVTVEDKLVELNAKLLKRAKKMGIPVGVISIPGVIGGDEAKIQAIKDQFDGIVEKRVTIPTKKLPAPKP